MHLIFGFVRRLIASLFFLIVMANAYAQRVTQADIYGDAEGGGGGGIGGTIGLLIFGAVVVWGFISDKGFRLGVLAYVGFLGGMVLIFREFGKEVGIGACVIAIIVLLAMDKKSGGK